MLNRRQFMGSTSAFTVAMLGAQRFAMASDSAENSLKTEGFGPLVTDSEGLLDLPRGFRYQVIAEKGKPMADGLITPGLADGMAAFRGPGISTIIVCNHEQNPLSSTPFGRDYALVSRIKAEFLYDAGSGLTPSCGGTTTIVYDTQKQTVLRQFLSLGGTQRNCAGGPTPWNSWITCEETVQRAGYVDKYKLTVDKDHGYNFEVPAKTEVGLAEPVPLKAMGRFNHEAVAVDPRTSIVYQTEDRDDGLITRYIPDKPRDLAAGGRLQALAIQGRPGADLRNWGKDDPVRVGHRLTATWIDLEDVESPEDDLRYRGHKAGAARFARGEGMWFADGQVYFACTTGGAKRLGQIWKLAPSSGAGSDQLELFVEPNRTDLLNNADNLTAAPWGDLIICEDTTTKGPNRLVGITPEGKLYTFATLNAPSELAGACFAPDGSTLFVNAQSIGKTLAITGPWPKVASE